MAAVLTDSDLWSDRVIFAAIEDYRTGDGVGPTTADAQLTERLWPVSRGRIIFSAL